MSVLNNIHEEVEQAVTIEHLCKDLYRQELDDWMDGKTSIESIMGSVNERLQSHGVSTSVDYYERTGPAAFKMYIKVIQINIKDWLISEP